VTSFTFAVFNSCLTLAALSSGHLSIMDIKFMKCRFELTYFYDLLTYLKTIRAKVVMFGIKPKLMKCGFQLTYFYDLLTYLKTIRAKVVMFGIKPKLMKCRFELAYFND
jgi:hypothetical protein